MKHFDNLSTFKNSSPHHSGLQPDSHSKYFKKELLPIILLITVGAIGTLYSLNRSTGSNLSKTISKITSNKIIQTEETAPPPKSPLLGNTAFTEMHKSQLLIEGELEAKQVLSFTIENFDKKAKYDLHLGNGEVLHPRARTVHYTYPEPGKHKIRLLVNYKGDTAQLFEENIQIAPAIYIAPGSYREQ